MKVFLRWCAGGGGQGGRDKEGGEEARYVRYVEQAAFAAEGRVEYDMDDEDEEWLARHNKKVGACGAPVFREVDCREKPQTGRMLVFLNTARKGFAACRAPGHLAAVLLHAARVPCTPLLIFLGSFTVAARAQPTLHNAAAGIYLLLMGVELWCVIQL
jgi:hypothetical protein